MIFTLNSLSALGAIVTSLVQPSLQSAIAGPHFRGMLGGGPSASIVRRQTPGAIQLSISELQILYTEHSTFQGWMTTYFDSASTTDPSIAQLKTEYLAYDSWISAWINSTLQTVLSPASASPAAVTTPASGSAPTTASGPTYGPPDSQIAPTAAGGAPYAAGNSTAAAPGASGTASSGTFNAQASNNLAVYYGQTADTQNTSLTSVCLDPTVNIVVLAFLDDFFGAGGQPTLNFGSVCTAVTKEGAARNATGILDCTIATPPAIPMATAIETCQFHGKKVLLSLGGALSNTTFASDAQATSFASTLWNLFGAGTGSQVGRPFGQVLLDGFDIDTEAKTPQHYTTFVSALRALMNQDKTKTYYLSAAPQCPFPDASIPLSILQSIDFVFMQFYNNGVCNVGKGATFLSSFNQWSSALSSNSTTIPGPKLYVGMPACPACGPNGYVDFPALPAFVKSVQGTNVTNFGGVMLWDASMGINNLNNGVDYLQAVKSAFN